MFWLIVNINDMGLAGRKSYFEELNIANRYAELSEPYFKFLKKMLASEDKADQKWAAERLEKAYVKMIPQTLEGSQDKPLVIQLTNESATRFNISPEPEGSSDRPAQV